MKIKLIQTPKNYKFPLRTAAYCRVSTAYDEQQGSLESQIRAYTEYIQNNPLLKFEGVFSDTATGRNTKKRDEFKKLIAKCKRGKIDLVITKSISRFGRNTVDTIRTARLLADLGIDIYFEKENLHSLDRTTRMVFEIYAGYAQEESFSTSRNIKWGIEQCFRTGSSSYINRKCYGYRKGGNGRLEVNEEEAAVVAKIFDMYINGSSLGEIAKTLESDNTPAPSGGRKWGRQTILNILSNEKYIGDVLLQKTFIEDFLNPKQKRNNGEKAQYYVQNAHQPIVKKSDFEAINDERKNPRRTRKANKLSGKIICGYCGRAFRRITRSDGVVVWHCGNRVDNGKSACPEAVTIKEEDIWNLISEKGKPERIVVSTFGVELVYSNGHF